MWWHWCSQTVPVHSGFLLGKWNSYRNQGQVHGVGQEESTSDEGAAPGGRLPVSIPEGQQAVEVKRDALFDVGGVEGDTVPHREAYPQTVDELVGAVWNWNAKWPDGSYCYSEAFRKDKALEVEKALELEVDDAAKARKETPIFSGVLQYFPRALAEVAKVSRIGNEQHNPGSPLHWDRSKSGDELDALTRHLMDAGTLDTDGTRHSAKVAWRALANLEKELENE